MGLLDCRKHQPGDHRQKIKKTQRVRTKASVEGDEEASRHVRAKNFGLHEDCLQNLPNGQMSVKVSSLPMLVLQKQGEVIGKGIPTYVMARVNNRFIQTPKFTCTQNNIYEGLLKGDCGLSTPISGNYDVVITSFEKNEQPVCNDGSVMVYSSGKDWGDSPTL